MAETAGAAPKRFPWLALVLGGLAFIILIGLGSWQVERLRWKEALLATIDQRVHSEPVSVAQLVKLLCRDGRRRLLAGHRNRRLRPCEGTALLRHL